MINLTILKETLELNDLAVHLDKDCGHIAIALYSLPGEEYIVSVDYDKHDPSTILPMVQRAISEMSADDTYWFGADAKKAIECITEIFDKSLSFEELANLNALTVDIVGIDSHNNIFGSVSFGEETLDFTFNPKDDDFIVPDKGNSDILSDNLDELSMLVTKKVKEHEVYAKWPASKPLTINDLPDSLAKKIARAQTEVSGNTHSKDSFSKDER